MSTQRAKESDNSSVSIANDNWNGLLELSRDSGRFQLKKKPKIVDISSVSEDIEKTSQKDDSIHKENLAKDEKLLKDYEQEQAAKESLEGLKKSRTVNSTKKPIVLGKTDINKDLHTEPVNDSVISTMDTMGVALQNTHSPSKVSSARVHTRESRDLNDVTAKQAPSVSTQTKQAVTSPIQTTVDAKVDNNVYSKDAVKENKVGMLKSLGKGLAYLYVNKTSSILNPVKFFMDNYKKFFMALVQLGVPAVIAWYVTTQIPFVSQQINATGSIMSVVYSLVFYVAILFLWCSGLFLLSMIGGMLKREALELAKLGKQKE